MSEREIEIAPYDSNAICPKCGGDKIATRYRGPIEDDPGWYQRKYSPGGKWPEYEYQHRTCERCEYDWPEAIASSIRQGTAS